jgi:hypothetical protein
VNRGAPEPSVHDGVVLVAGHQREEIGTAADAQVAEPFTGGDPSAKVVCVVVICAKSRRHAPWQRSSGSAALESPSEPPAERMRLHVVPVRNEAFHGMDEILGRGEGRVLEHSTGDDAEPDLYLIDPGGV